MKSQYTFAVRSSHIQVRMCMKGDRAKSMHSL